MSDIDSDVYEFLDKEKVLTISANFEQEIWSATCLYQFNKEDMEIYLITDTSTRHGQLMLKSPDVSGTIISAVKNIGFIKGIQYKAKVFLLAKEKEARAREHYYRKFPLGRVLKTPIWRLVLEEIKYTQSNLGLKKQYCWVRGN